MHTRTAPKKLTHVTPDDLTHVSNTRQQQNNSRSHSDSSIITGDVIAVLESLSTKPTFDVVIADPPYNIGKDFGNNTDNLHPQEYVVWSLQWINRCLELLTDNGIMYIYGFPEMIARIAVNYPLDRQRWLVWHYTNKVVPSSTFWQRSHESILCLWNTDSPRPSLEIDQIREPYTDSYMNNAGKVRASTHSRFGGKNSKETIYNAHKNGALPRDVIKIPALAGGAGATERWFMCLDCSNQVFHPSCINDHRSHNILKHPTQKPMELTKRLLLSRIKGQAGRLLVPFSGSGSECVTAKLLNIPYLGIEINPQYVDFANKWIIQMEQRAETTPPGWVQLPFWY